MSPPKLLIDSRDGVMTLSLNRLDKLNALYHLQTVRFHDLQREYALALRRLNLRLVDIYKSNEPTTVDVRSNSRHSRPVPNCWFADAVRWFVSGEPSA